MLILRDEPEFAITAHCAQCHWDSMTLGTWAAPRVPPVCLHCGAANPEVIAVDAYKKNGAQHEAAPRTVSAARHP